MKKAFIQLHIAVFLAGFTGILGKLITLNEGLLVWYRLLIASGTLWGLFFLGRNRSSVHGKDAGRLFGIGAIAALHWLTFYGSIKYANVSIALVCFSSIGFFTSLLEPWYLGTKLDPVELGLGLLVMIGIYFIFQFDHSFKIGIIAGLVSALLGSIFPILNRPLLQRIIPDQVTLYELTGGFLFISLLMPAYLHYFPTFYLIPGWKDFLWLLALSWLCTVVAFTLSMKALKKISAFTVNLTYNLEPVYGIILAFAVFGENKYFGFASYFGFTLVILAISIQMLRLRRKFSRLLH